MIDVPPAQAPRISGHRIFDTPFAAVYLAYVQNVGRKGRARDELDGVIRWLTGYDAEGLARQVERKASFEAFFDEAPALHPNRVLVKGLVCGVRVEEVEGPLMRTIRQLENLVDELAKGKAMDKVLRR